MSLCWKLLGSAAEPRYPTISNPKNLSLFCRFILNAMSTILFITVGGSPAPIITAIQSLKPDRTIFICSEGPRGSVSQVLGEGTPCEIRKGSEVLERLPNLPTHLGLVGFDPEADVVALRDPDDLAEAYQRISERVQAVRRAEPGAQVVADYTGGTKTMALALGAVALDQGVSLYLTTSAMRENLVRVERGESTSRAATSGVTVERSLSQDLPRFLEQYNYGGAIALLTNLLATYELSPEQRRRIQELRDICIGFDAWDRFDHRDAWSLLSLRLQRKDPCCLALKRVLSSRAGIDPEFSAAEAIPGHGYELVEDLLRNAQRRAHQQRCDDAVGRLYRALELLVQLRLKLKYDILTGDVAIAKLPESLREPYEAERDARKGKIQLPLIKSYILLSELPEDPLGQYFIERRPHVLDAINIRNHSLFAHGVKPITATEYQTSGAVIQTFIETALDKLIPAKQRHPFPQFPTQL
jgi:CRISPR-associated protein (TIGR02710 family)